LNSGHSIAFCERTVHNRTQVFDVATKTARGVGVFTAYAFAVCALFGFTVVAAIIVAAT
jgi:hypothetical protein